ncbi:tail fiber protein [Escherichia coli]|uniref:tail fiber protein n=1 Tax=Escherichia coli TaxID=562 RepID=UPI000DA483D2|nr:tail fiber protein [Escherichia coli]SQO15623.1 major tail fiber protein [Escherichia coli]SVF53169.1 major tail fiber protein [Escherichia coli]SVF53269.1 major tail fiber protein [Escherichia coli]
MGADKTNNIMTLSSGVSQPLLADVQYFELYSSSALNRKLKNIVLPGFYCGFEPVPGTGLSVRITSENSEGKGAASVDVNNVQISVQQIEDVTVSVKAGATNIIVLEANFEHGVKTTQVESASSVSAARIYARTDNTIGQNQIELCRVIVPNGATAVTKEMIVLKYRVNRAVGVEFSNEISSTEERKAATPLAVKTLHDLVDTKAPLDSPHLSGTPTSPTPEPGTNNTQIANAAFVKAAITALINGAPGTLDTLKEIAAAINNDPNFSTTINNALALKAPLASPALTGIPTAPTAAQGTNNTQIATTAYVRAAISALVGSSPEALDTLNELAAALGNDPNFATTMTNALAGKQPLDATLTALAALATGANKLPYFTGKDTVAQTDLTSVGRDILAKTSTLAVIQYLGLRELGTSGEKIPLLSTANTWSARQTFNGGITGALTGNADTATKLKTARTIGGVAFDGSANINLPGVNTTGNQNTTGNAATATKLATARNINGVKFDGSGDVNINTLVSRGRVTALSGSTQGTAGIQMYEAYNNSYPTTYGNVLHMKGASAAGEGELLIGWSGTSGAHAPVFIRSRRDNTDAAWSAWAQVYTSKDSIPGVNTTGNQNTTGNAATATKLATARNINGVKFDGSGDVNINTLVSRGRVTALSGSTQGTAGIQMYEAYNNSYPTTYGNVLHMKGASAAGEGELLIGWSGTSGAHAPVFIRSRRDNTDAAWSAWAQVYTSKDSIPGVNTTGNQNTTGNAATATKLQTARTIGGVSFDGSANINLPGVNIAGNQNTTGNAATATKLQTARTINGVSFDGSKNIELTAEDLNLEQTVELAAGALQKNQNGADIPGKDTFTKNIGACRAFHSAISTGAGNWTTAQLIEWLDSQGAFNHPYWMCKCSWSYGNNKIITDTGCGTIHLAGCVIEVMGNKGAMTIRVTTPSTSSGGGTTNAQFTYINHGDAYAPGWRRDYNTKNQQPAFALGKTGSTVGNDKAVGWNWNSGVYQANIGGASTLILHFNMSEGSCPAVQFRVNYRNGGIFYRSARDGYGFEADWSEFYTTTRKPSAGDVGAYTQAECNSRFITGIRLGGLSSVKTWNGPGWSDRSGYVVTGSVNGNRDELIDTTQARPIQYCINGTWYNAGSI